MPFKYAFVLPIINGIWFPATFIITYIISVMTKHVTPDFPYISDTGTWSPESCFFSLMLNVGAVLLFSIVYIRYRQVEYLLDNHSFKSFVKTANSVGLMLGMTAAVGICLVGNFQETNVLAVHVGAAFMAFGLGVAYQCTQTRICFELYPIFGSKNLNITRIIFSVISALTFLLTFVFAAISMLQFTGEDPTKWMRNHGGYKFHLVSTVSEWILVIVTISFLTLFAQDFRKIAISQPIISEIN